MAVRQYIGARYVPVFGRKDEESIQWDNTKPYEPLTIVIHEGNSYTSRQYVPIGIDILNGEYWALTGNYNAQVEQYRSEVREVQDSLGGIDNRLVSIEGLFTDGQLNGTNIVDESITEIKIADGAITSGKIADNSITEDKIVDSAITSDKIADNSITEDKIPDGSITVEKLAPNEYELPDTIWNGTPVIRTLKEPGYGLQGMCVWPLDNPIYCAIGKASSSDITQGAVDIYNIATNSRIGTVAGSFYHATDITYSNGKLYVSAGGNAPIVIIVNVSDPMHPSIEQSINYSGSGIATVFGFGDYDEDSFYLVESLYNNGFIHLVDKTTMNITGQLCRVPKTSGLYQTITYNRYFESFMFISSQFSNIAFFKPNGQTYKVVNLRKQYQFIPIGELEAVCSVGKTLYFSNNPTETSYASQVQHGAVWKCDIDSNMNNSEYTTRYAQNNVFVWLSNNASGLNTENSDGNQFPGINASYPIMLKYPEDLPAIAMLTDNRITVQIKNDLTGIIPLIGGSWFVEYDDSAASYKIPGIYVAGATAAFTHIAQVPFSDVELTISGHKVLICARDSRVSIANSFATDVSATAYVVQADVNSIVIHPSQTHANNIKVVNGGVSIVSNYS